MGVSVDHVKHRTTNEFYILIFRVDLTNESSETDLLSHDTSIYNNLPKLNNYTQKLCHCNENGTICSYHHYQDCKTSSWGPKLACILHNNKRKERDITAIQQMYCEQKDYQRSEVTYPKVERNS